MPMPCGSACSVPQWLWPREPVRGIGRGEAQALSQTGAIQESLPTRIRQWFVKRDRSARSPPDCLLQDEWPEQGAIELGPRKLRFHGLLIGKIEEVGQRFKLMGPGFHSQDIDLALYRADIFQN